MQTGGVYNKGVAWNGLTAVTESPSGAEASPIYADNIKYVNLVSNEEFGATVEAYMYPDEFAECGQTTINQMQLITVIVQIGIVTQNGTICQAESLTGLLG